MILVKLLFQQSLDCSKEEMIMDFLQTTSRSAWPDDAIIEIGGIIFPFPLFTGPIEINYFYLSIIINENISSAKIPVHKTLLVEKIDNSLKIRDHISSSFWPKGS
eukprot:m.227014 g.227014  ORF g.227014 m.227014 type:complete len:105 (+) comp40035_c0_seq5:503-817(+)